jgi:ubiquinone/menaquinone biosynthesis C-methylase UbiE
MDMAYWDDKAEVYEDEIFNVWRRDRNGLLAAFFKEGKLKNKTVLDCGCGIGHGISVLSKCCKFVHAVDISKECLAVAKKRYGLLPNVEFSYADLSCPQFKLPITDLAVAVNSVITPSIQTRLKMLKTIHRHLTDKGLLVLVVPSLESYYYVAYKLTEWNLRDGSRQCLRFRSDAISKGHGVVPIDGVLTKHYLKEELMTFLQLTGFNCQRIEKICYDWDTEYEEPPNWMQAPYPWDWMCVARKKNIQA